MTNQEHLVILKQGVEVWNQWRNRHTTIQPDLRGTDLTGAILRGANLSGANLSGADLSNADLSSADLSGAIIGGVTINIFNVIRADFSGFQRSGAVLSGANLSNADLSGAILRGAYLSGVNFRRANLSHADLSYTDLSGADLSDAHLIEADLIRADLTSVHLAGANLHNARVGRTFFGDLDLRTVKGLETLRNEGPSTIGTDTIVRSQGNIPEAFLRGAGLPDTFIEYARSLVQRPIQYYTCFISYSSKDQLFAERLYADLQNKGIRCWFAPHDLRTGDRIRDSIDEAIRLYDKLLLILSKHSVESTWVRFEVEAALEKETQRNQAVLFPLRLDESVMTTTRAWAASLRRERYISDFTRWKQHDDYQQALKRLLRNLKAESSPQAQ